MEVNRESMDYDVVVVGAGPSGLATAIKIKQLLKIILLFPTVKFNISWGLF